MKSFLEALDVVFVEEGPAQNQLFDHAMNLDMLRQDMVREARRAAEEMAHFADRLEEGHRDTPSFQRATDLACRMARYEALHESFTRMLRLVGGSELARRFWDVAHGRTGGAQ